MKKLMIGVVGAIAVTTAIIAADGFNGSGKPSYGSGDQVINNGIEWTRRGSMGTKDYVITDLDLGLISPLKYLYLTPQQEAAGVTFLDKGTIQNGAVESGRNASANLSQEYISTLTTPTKIRNVGVAIGTQAKAEDSEKTLNQSIAIGFWAHALGSNAIAIGGGNKHNDPTSPDYEDDLTGHNAFATNLSIAIGYATKAAANNTIAIGTGQSRAVNPTEATKPRAIAIGDRAHAVAQDAVQIGTGTNDTENSLKFRDVWVVKNGKIAGFDDSSLDPANIDASEAVSGSTDEVIVKPHVLNTLVTDVTCGPGTEVGVRSSGSRNYELYVENEDNIRHGLPLNFDCEVDGAKMIFLKGDQQCAKLPVHIKIQQPTTKTILISVTELDDGYDWTPNVTNSFIKYDSANNKFICEGNKRSIEGSSLQLGTEFKIAYPTASGVTTNDFLVGGKISGTFYDYVMSGELTPSETPVTTDFWYEIIYTTVNGTAEVKRFNENVLQ